MANWSLYFGEFQESWIDQSNGWGLVSTHSYPQFWFSKKNSKTTQFIELYSGVSEQIKALQPIGQAAEFKFESKFKPLPVIWQSLPKAIPEENRRFWLQNQWPSSWGRALGRVRRASTLGLVRWASINTGSFLVGGSRCLPRQARFRITCYHSCYTDSVQESKGFDAL